MKWVKLECSKNQGLRTSNFDRRKTESLIEWKAVKMVVITFRSCDINPVSANPAKWSNTLKQFVGCLSVFANLVGLAFNGLRKLNIKN